MPGTCYELSGFRFSLSADDPVLSAALEVLYPALCAGEGPCSSAWTIRLGTDQDGPPQYTLYHDDRLLHRTSDRLAMLAYLEWKILQRLLQHRADFLQLHAAGAVCRGRGLLLSGPSGSGKSTLALSLLLSGWSCLSDEIILLEPEGRRVWPFPRSFHLKEETLGMFPQARLPGAVKGFTDSSGKIRLDPAGVRRDWVAPPAEPEWLVFPVYSPDKTEGLTPLGETQALSLLLDQVINLADHGSEGMDTLLRLVRRCSCYSLQMRHPDSGCRLLEKMVEDSLSSSAVCRETPAFISEMAAGVRSGQ